MNKRNGKQIATTISSAFMILMVLLAGCVQKPVAAPTTPTRSVQTINETLVQEKIKGKLIGLEITYRSKRGEIEKYNVTEKDVKTINETWLDNKKVWKVRIGEAMAWDYYFDEKGEKIIKTEQLFRT